MTTTASSALDVARRDSKAAIRGVLAELAGAAEAAGLPSTARDIRDTRLPKLDDERFSLVVLGEFNHGKSTFINALLGEPILPTGHHADHRGAGAHHATARSAAPTLVIESGERKPIDAAGARRLADGRRAGQAERKTAASKTKAPASRPPRRDRPTRRRSWRTG